jgi:hypothetical protein
MRIAVLWIPLFAAVSACRADEITLSYAKSELTAAMAKLQKVVTFCEYCNATGKTDDKTCTHCNGQGAILKAEEKLIGHKAYLETRAEQAGVARDRYAEFDIAHRLEKYEKDIEPEALKMLAAYVDFAKAYQKHKEVIKEDEEFAQQVEKAMERLDALIDRHGPRLSVPSMRMLYEDKPVGKVGAFKLYGNKKTLRIDGKDVEQLQIRTLKEYSILIMEGEAKKRKGFLLAEIIGKDTYHTDDGQDIPGILMQAY